MGDEGYVLQDVGEANVVCEFVGCYLAFEEGSEVRRSCRGVGVGVVGAGVKEGELAVVTIVVLVWGGDVIEGCIAICEKVSGVDGYTCALLGDWYWMNDKGVEFLGEGNIVVEDDERDDHNEGSKQSPERRKVYHVDRCWCNYSGAMIQWMMGGN